ncbi:MAG: glycosyltransferase family 2 protein [Chitinophagia bacterium]|nr:glycosyltransferase family 2 protein [Chitinophagia bacterium]
MTSVAIAIPNFNGEQYLYETLQSLQMQKVKPDEKVFSDNFSTDHSLEIVEMFPDLNVRVIQPDRFLKMSENWNYVANQVRSDWFFLLSNDDLLRDTAVKRLKEIAEGLASNIGVISFKSEIVNEDSKLVLGKYRIGKGKLREAHEFLEENIKFLHINAASVAIKKVSYIDVGGFPTEYSVLHDLVFYQRLILKWGILESKEVLGRYRIYGNKPNSEARSLLVLEDFQTYESFDLKRYVEKYPDLLLSYTYKESQNAAKPLSRIFWIRKFHTFVLLIMTICRRGQSVLRHSGFPGRS